MRTVLLLGGATLMALMLPGAPAAPVPTLPAFADAYRSATAAMHAAGPPYATWAAAGRRFLAFDPRGDGTAAEVIGDLATADRIAVLVPGADTALPDFDRGLGGVARRAPATQARALYRQLRAAHPDARVAVVAWLGYDTPDGTSLDVVRESAARNGARALTGFVRGLVAQRPGAAVTLVGHSYGAIVVGLAAPDLPEVGDLVALGAPGMGAGRAADLGGARVWAALAPADWIRRVPAVRLLDLGHGRRPSAPAFGARPLPTAGVSGHDGYLVPGSATLDAVAEVVLGRMADTEAAR
ncbi:alpha/beta hydrolase [Jidongwangia harbinensis]|uniref:alpha/beta hydrolase n=1 Tax=Jidongwangia harbinensis TaxID=2878561 RepID=UPI001CDA2977|nr:alpha/beta hydrolase [Jidongwangia harbinensis]MCA2212208.1 alpha/beta hydrolase family protein [Jidongwangia harbinensis]